MEKIMKYKKELIILASAIVVSLLALIIFMIINNRKITIGEFETENYRVTYDSTWTRVLSDPLNLILEHSKGATISFDIYNLEGDFRFMPFLNLVNEIEYAVAIQNEDYQLVARQNTTVTKNNYEGYQFLYETEKDSLLVVVALKGEQILTITYHASMEEFDLLLDSVQEIIYNFELISLSFELANRVSDIKFGNLSLLSNANISIGDSIRSQIAANQFLVEYEIPNNFLRINFNTMMGSYEFSHDTRESIQIRTSILPNNIYRHMEGIEKLFFRSSALENKSLIENYTKVNDTKYIYQAIYTNEAFGVENEHEVIHIMYALDHRRTFLIEISARNMRIPKKMLDNIKMVSSRRIALHIVRDIEDGVLRNDMKVMLDSREQKHNVVTLFTPELYFEYEPNFMPRSKYQERIFRRYINERDFDIETRYEFIRTFSTNQIESQLNSLENSRFRGSTRESLGKRTYNDKEFTVYRFNFTNEDGRNQVHTLIYEFEGTVLFISVRGINRTITEADILDFTKFDIRTVAN